MTIAERNAMKWPQELGDAHESDENGALMPSTASYTPLLERMS